MNPIEETAGDASGAILVMRDISDQKRSLELLREIEERYLQTQKLEAVGLLAGGIAHEFNNLLTVISGYTTLLLNKSQIDQDSRERLEGIELAGERARRLTRRLLSFSRRQVFEAKVVDLNTLVAAMAQMLRQLISEDIVLITSLASALDRVRVDPGQLEQSLMNLVLNARDAMPGGGSLSIETANVGLEESLHLEHLGVLPGRYVRLTVKDTGCGMTQEVKERIFEPFFTTKEPGSGTGLGLATVYGTVQRSQGHLTVESEPGKGTTFNMFLPAVEEEVQPLEINPAPMIALSAQETVLLVEDDDLVRACILQFLQEQGYTVLETGSPEEALIFCKEYRGSIHLLVTDVVMPGMGGHQLAERAIEFRKGMKVLYISGYPSAVAADHGIMESRVPFLQKPFTPGALARKVREVLDVVVKT
jgi:signal transduction histidine kinase